MSVEQEKQTLSPRQTVLLWAYIAVLIALPLLHLWDKWHTDSGGFSSRYSPLCGAVLWASGCVLAAYRIVWLWRWVWWLVLWTVTLAYLVAAVIILTVMWVHTWSVVAVWAYLWLGLGVVLAPGYRCWWAYVYQRPVLWQR